MKYRAMIKMAMLAAVMFSVNIANAAFITGDMGTTGSFTANNDLDLATAITLTSATGTSGTGDIGSSVGFGTSGAIGDGNISLTSFASVTDLYTMGGWQLDLTSMSVTDQTASLLTMEGGGLLSGNGMDSTSVFWTFSGNTTGSSYSMTVTAVPVPAAIWLFGSGLLGLVGIARRKIS